MCRNVCLLLAAVVWTPWVAAQLPGTPATAPRPDDLVTFDYHQAEVRWVNNRWELYAGGVWLKDFGAREVEAREALRLLRSLRLTQHGTVGSPRPIMEYWLCEGQAPQALGGGLRLLPIDLASLRVEELQGQWCVRDADRLLFTFGAQQEEANRAVEIIRRYGFSQIGYVGQPIPSMIYFLGGRDGLGSASLTPRLQTRPMFSNKPGPGTNQPGQTGDFLQTSFTQGQQIGSTVRQLAPPTFGSATRINFDYRQVVVRRDQNQWKLFFGNYPLLGFGADQQLAQQALAVLQHYRFTEQCFIGQPTPAFSFFLANGQAPWGVKFGLDSQGFRPESVSARQVGNEWMVCEDGRPLLRCGERENDARQLVQVIQTYHFDHLCRLGPPQGPGMTFFTRTH